jgi:hypothetical protein
MRCEIFDRLAVGCLRKQPTGAEENRRLAVLEKVVEEVPNQPSIALSYLLSRSPRATFATSVSTRESIPCPALLSMFPGRQARDNQRRGRGFHQTTTIGLRRLELRLDYVGLVEGGAEFKAGSD